MEAAIQCNEEILNNNITSSNSSNSSIHKAVVSITAPMLLSLISIIIWAMVAWEGINLQKQMLVSMVVRSLILAMPMEMVEDNKMILIL